MDNADDKRRKTSVIADQWVIGFLQYAYWLRDKTVNHIQHVLLCVLSAGPIPGHVAFILDGHRRYARSKGMKVIEGHMIGSFVLLRVRLTPLFLFNG
jgi:hypothetical protein